MINKNLITQIFKKDYADNLRRCFNLCNLDFNLCNHKSYIFLALAISIFSLLGCGSEKNPVSPIEVQNHYRVKKVIDGDTIVLDNDEVVRYIGIDTPEIRHKVKYREIYEPQPYALEAKEFNQRLVEGKVVKLDFDVQKKDVFGRLIAYIYVGDIFINAELLREGYALPYTSPPNVKHAELFAKLYREAREEKRGLWATEGIISSEEAMDFIGHTKVVEGRVLSIYKGKKAVHLNFGEDWRKDFTVVIFKNDWRAFAFCGIASPDYYKGKKLRVLGLIKKYNGPEIIVRHPVEIEIVE